MKKQLTSLLALFSWITLAPAADEPTTPSHPFTAQTKTELSTAVQNSLSVFKHDFKVEIQSPKLFAILQEDLTEGLPLPITIKHLQVSNEKGKGTFKTKMMGLGLPPEAIRELEKQANAEFEDEDVEEFWELLTGDFMKEANEVIGNAKTAKILKQNDNVLLLGADKLDEPFEGNIRLNEIRFVIDRKQKLVRGARLGLSGGKELIVKFAYGMHKRPTGGESVPAFSSLELQHNAWLGRLLGFIKFPNKSKLTFKNYKFK